MPRRLPRRSPPLPGPRDCRWRNVLSQCGSKLSGLKLGPQPERVPVWMWSPSQDEGTDIMRKSRCSEQQIKHPAIGERHLDHDVGIPDLELDQGRRKDCHGHVGSSDRRTVPDNATPLSCPSAMTCSASRKTSPALLIKLLAMLGQHDTLFVRRTSRTFRASSSPDKRRERVAFGIPVTRSVDANPPASTMRMNCARPSKSTNVFMFQL